MAQPWISAGALCCVVAVVAGAFGAHGLKSRLDPAALQLWETAARYFMYGGLGLLAIGLAALHQGADRGLQGAAVCLLAGSIVFSATVAVLALGGPRWLGAITPIGGLFMIVGFLWFAWAAWRF